MQTKFFIFLSASFEGGIDELKEHLNYLQKYDGTPDFWDSNSDALEVLNNANNIAKSNEDCIVVVTDDFYNIFQVINYVDGVKKVKNTL